MVQLNPVVNQKQHKYEQYFLYLEVFVVQIVPPSKVFGSKTADLVIDYLWIDCLKLSSRYEYA